MEKEKRERKDQEQEKKRKAKSQNKARVERTTKEEHPNYRNWGAVAQ